MRISESGGEGAVIKFVESICGGDDPRVVLGFGDDAALLQSGERLLVVTTDLLVEGTHFRRETMDPYSLGWKAVAVNISDVAAMGGEPTFAFVSIALPDVDIGFVRELYQGMEDISRRFGSRVVGGDTNRVTGEIVINVAQLGEVEKGHQTLRSAARVGDRLLVTGTLGDSLAGFRLLDALGAEKARVVSEEAVMRHLRPIPRVPEARAAVAKGLIHGMMDLSDGLAIDLGKMCEASGVGARVFPDRLPVSDALRAAAERLGEDPAALAASGGEDYELLIAAAPESAQELIDTVRAATGTLVTEIGEFVEGDGAVLVDGSGAESPLRAGWKHF
jgi:thiamine-monophosphate kinase